MLDNIRIIFFDMDRRKAEGADNINNGIKGYFSYTDIDVLAVHFWALLEDSNIDYRVDIRGVHIASRGISDHIDMVNAEFYQRVTSFLRCGKRFVDYKYV